MTFLVADEINFLILIGVDVNFKGQTHHIDIIFLHVLGDNLGIHEALGLSMCFSQGEICRNCLATYEAIQTNPGSDYTPRLTYPLSPLANIIGVDTVVPPLSEPMIVEGSSDNAKVRIRGGNVKK